MKRIFALLLLISVGICCLVSCKSDFKDASEGEYAQNSGGYTLFVPQDWEVTLSTDCTFATAEDGTAVTVTPFTMSNAYYQTVETAWDKIKSNFNTFFAGDYSIIQEENEDFALTVDGCNAGEFLYTGTVAGVEMKYKTVLTIYNTYLYSITFSSTPQLFDSHEDDFDGIIKHFKFSSAKQAPDGFKAADKPDKVQVKDDKFTMSVDRDWITDNSTGVLFARYANGFPSCISVMTADMTGFESADEYFESFIPTFEKSMKEFTLIENECSDDSVVAGKPAYSYVYTAYPAVDDNGEDILYKYCQVLVPDGNEVYIITYSSSANTEVGTGYYDTHYQTFIDVLANFTINK